MNRRRVRTSVGSADVELVAPSFYRIWKDDQCLGFARKESASLWIVIDAWNIPKGFHALTLRSAVADLLRETGRESNDTALNGMQP